jgi:ribose/xylose/arabinose/galactoside ABC-type transport system permease subunit
MDSTTSTKINKPSDKTGKSISQFFTKYGLAFVLLAVMAVFALLEPKFIGYKNIFSILISSSITAIAAMGFVVIMSSGEIDFAIGMEFSLAGIIMMMMMRFSGLNFWIVFPIMYLLMLTFGLFNAFLNISIGIPAFLATMGTSLIAKFVAWTLTGGLQVTYINLPKIVNYFGQGFLFKIIPVPIVIFIFVSIIMIIYTDRTKNGKKMYAVGSNPAACNFVGINFRIEKLKGFLICAALACTAGFIQASNYNRGQPDAGVNLMVSCLTSLMLGALFLKPGVFNIPGTIIGAILVGSIANGLQMLAAPTFMKNFVTGGIMLAAVVVTTIIRKNSEKVGSG